MDNKENLRDLISKNDYKRKNNMENILCNTICKNFNEDEFKSFFDSIIFIIEENGNNRLKDLYLSRYYEILKICNKTWKNKLHTEPLLLILES